MLAPLRARAYSEKCRATLAGRESKKVLTELIIIAAPFVLLILVTAAGVDLTDTELIAEYEQIEKERN